jgi:hypothetical protein
MEADNQNSWNALRHNLDELSEIPGEPAFNTNAAWNKLNGRLVNKPLHRKPAFYWAAAAMLLLLLTAGWLTLQKPSETNLAKNKQTVQPLHKAEASGAPLISSRPSITDKQKNDVQQIVKTIRKTNQGIRKETSKPMVTDTSTYIQVQTTPALPTDALVSTSIEDSLILVEAAPVKKLKVIHNNQLNSVIYKPELSVSNAPVSNFPSSGHIRFSRNSSDNILQIKLSLTN